MRDAASESRWRRIEGPGTIALMIVAVSLMHYSTAIHIHEAHGIYRRLYYFPILLAAFRYGRRGGLAAAFATCAFYAPHAFGLIGFDPAFALEKSLEMVLYFAVGLVAGVLVDREHATQRSLRRTRGHPESHSGGGFRHWTAAHGIRCNQGADGSPAGGSL